MEEKYINNEEALWEAYEKYSKEYHGGYLSGIQGVDKIIRLTDGSLTIFVGRPGEGKTTFLNYWLYMLAKTSGLSTLYLSFETPVVQHISRLMNYFGSKEQLFNYCHFRVERLPNNLEILRKTIITHVKIYGVKVVVIDPFNQIDEVGCDSSSINDALNQIRRWANELGIAIILCHHVTKGAKSVNVQNAAGSYMFNSICDNAMSIKADFDTNTSKISTHKIRYDGDNGKAHSSVTLEFDPTSKIYYAHEEDPDVTYDGYDPEKDEIIDMDYEEVDSDAKIRGLIAA